MQTILKVRSSRFNSPIVREGRERPRLGPKVPLMRFNGQPEAFDAVVDIG
jgi:hypothetical protein